MKQLDAGGGYRAQVERDLAKRLGEAAEKPEPASHTCAKCSTTNDSDAKFCKNRAERAVKIDEPSPQGTRRTQNSEF